MNRKAVQLVETLLEGSVRRWRKDYRAKMSDTMKKSYQRRREASAAAGKFKQGKTDKVKMA